MARPPRNKSPSKPAKITFWLQRLIYWILRGYLKFWTAVFLFIVSVVFMLNWVNPPITYLMVTEYQRLGTVAYRWRDLEDMSPNIPLAVAAAEDANFCAHNGFDFDAIEAALEEGSGRGASTISQQVAKNVFLWPGRSWWRKGFEAGFTVLIEALWSKRRIMEVYLNVAEMDEGVFGVDIAVPKYFRTGTQSLRLADAARLAVILPNPRGRSPRNLTGRLQRRASRIAIGGSTLRAEGRADCFLDKPTP